MSPAVRDGLQGSPRQRGEAVGDTAVAGNALLRRDFREGLEDEGAFAHARMGEREAGFVHGQVVVEEEVEVEGAGGVFEFAMAAVARFDVEQGMHELAWGKLSDDGSDSVDEVGLIQVALGP